MWPSDVSVTILLALITLQEGEAFEIDLIDDSATWRNENMPSIPARKHRDLRQEVIISTSPTIKIKPLKRRRDEADRRFNAWHKHHIRTHRIRRLRRNHTKKLKRLIT
uniref:Secreted protein n=1 Tax=Ascaris lumbricoides TaxID=6252 RepID=A0A0M3I4W7_ASCLU